jgi:HEAT repeat protein
MKRFPRIAAIFALALCFSAPASWISARGDDTGMTPPAATPDNSAGGAPAPAPATPDNSTPAATPSDNTGAAAQPTATPDQGTPATGDQEAPPTLNDLVDTYWHYGKIADYALAADAGQKILSSGSDPDAVLMAFEAVTARHNDNIDTWMIRWKSLPTSDESDRAAAQAMRDVTTKLVDVINQGYADRRNNPDFIRKTIFEMSVGERAYDNNLPRVSESGEVAVKVIIDILRDSSLSQYHDVCRRILRDLGRKALNPLLAATEMKDYNTLLDVVTALGDIGYEAALPYLARLAASHDVPEGIHNAAMQAMWHIGLDRNATVRASELFYSLAEKCYYGKSDLEPAGDKQSNIWYWNDDKGLSRKIVPTPIFNDLLAMRACEYTLKLNPSSGTAVALWLAANTKRECDLPAGAGAVDTTHEGDPDANYYNVSAGANYLNEALARATTDRNAAVALKLCNSLRDITGQGNMNGQSITPLMQALFFPNRQVRYAAAFALAQSLPTRPFSGSDRVVPLLVEAVNQTNKPGIVVVAPATSDTLSVGDLRDAVQSLGYPVVAANTPSEAAQAAVSLPTVDLIIISEDSDVRKMIDLEQNIARLQGASMLVLTHTVNSPYAVATATDELMNADVIPPKAQLKDVLNADIETARQHSGTAVMSEQDASAYALEAATLLEKLAITRGQAFDMSVAEGGLLQALNDPRPEIAKAAGRVLATLKSPSAQNGLALKANSTATPVDVRVSLYHSLADSAKHIGNHLDGEMVSALEHVVTDSTDASIRDAAAEARGALDLPADAARMLILKQSKV